MRDFHWGAGVCLFKLLQGHSVNRPSAYRPFQEGGFEFNTGGQGDKDCVGERFGVVHVVNPPVTMV